MTMLFVRRLREFQTMTDDTRHAVLDKTLPGWTDEARAMGFQRTTHELQSQHEQTQNDFNADYHRDAMALQRELMARLGIPVRHDGESLKPLRYDSADYLEKLAQSLEP